MQSEKEKHLLSGYGFTEHGPYLEFDCTTSKGWERQNITILQQPITLSRFKGRYCIGRYNLDDFSVSPCPDQYKLPPGYPDKRCPRCKQANQFVPAFYNLERGNIPEKQVRYNANPHVVYLAYFGQNLFKVGISHHKRVLDRWREQGARRAIVITHAGDAYEARQYEELVRNTLNIPEAISSRKKRQAMLAPISDDEVLKELDAIRHFLLSKYQFPLAYEDMQNLDPDYFGSAATQGTPAENLNTYADDLTANSPLVVSGVVHGLVGSILIVSNDDTTLLCDLKKIISHSVKLKWELTEYKSRGIQGALL